MGAPHRRRFTARSRRLLPAVAALASLLWIGERSAAEDGEASSVERAAAEIAASVSSTLQCTIDLRGTPRFDALANAWLVAYMAAGKGCDVAGDELRRRGKDIAVVFFRRPDSNQVRLLIANIRASVVPAFHCPISLRGDPSFDEGSGYWTVTFVASGPTCGDAATELSRLGADYQIRFQPVMPSQGLLD